MANQVLNRLTICGNHEDKEKIEKFFTDENGNVVLSLSKIIPEPIKYETFNSLIIQGIKKYLDDKTGENHILLENNIEHHEPKMATDKLIETYSKILDVTKNVILHDWRVSNWGCQWDVEQLKYLNNGSPEFLFKTCWSSPFKVIKTLSEQYPNLLFELEFADIELVRNCGCVVYDNGIKTSFNTWTREEAEEFWDLEYRCMDY